jgi:addiction module HigA family antidote
MKKKKLHPVHPGEVLMEEFLKPMGLSQNKLALNLGVHPRRINEIVLQKRRITADTALRLSKFFGTSAEFWLGLQSQYDLDIAIDELAARIDREVKEYSEIT